MLIAARNAMMAGGGWKNPYITDGLVAMWDGEWNAGGGVHFDTIPQPWANLGSGDCVASLSSNVTIGGNYIAPDVLTSNQIAYLTNSWATCGCIEIVIKYNGLQLWNVLCSNNTRYKGYGLIIANGPSIGSTLDGGTEPHLPLSELSVDQIYSLSFNFAYNGAISEIRKNGSVYSGSSAKNNLASYATNAIFRSSNKYNLLHTLRVYSRALTADEIAANYAVDKARFNLT